jgi:hypothetical protein
MLEVRKIQERKNIQPVRVIPDRPSLDFSGVSVSRGERDRRDDQQDDETAEDAHVSSPSAAATLEQV